MKLNNKNILLVGGGTGGHIVPVFEIYKKLKKLEKNYKILVVGSKSSIEENIYKNNKDFHRIITGKLRRQITFKNILEFFYLIIGFFQAFKLLISFKPKIIFSKGGYVSLPITVIAKWLKIPYIIHESDIEMGSTNKFSASGAIKIFVGFPSEFYSSVLKQKIVFCGQILRDMIKSYKLSEDRLFNFRNQKPILLITGGSQGSHNINKNIFETLPELLEHYNIIHQVGANDFDQALTIRSNLSNDLKNGYFVKQYLENGQKYDLMLEAIGRATIVICRAGATTIAEIIEFKKPMILIPYRYAARDHQAKNASYLKKHNAAIVIDDKILSKKTLIGSINSLIQSKELIKSMTNNAYDLFPHNGLEIICKEIENQIINYKKV